MVDNKEEKKEQQELKIMEWRYSQFLGEKLTWEQIKSDHENESFLVTNCKFSHDGSTIAVSDKGGRIILFKKNESKLNKQPKLDYFYEYAAQEKEFDVHKSVEYSEEIKGLSILPLKNHNKVDIITANARTIKLDRVYKDKVRIYDNSDGKSLSVPKVTHTKPEIKHKTKRVFKYVHHTDINTIAENKINPWHFASSDDHKIFLWDLNVQNEVFNVVDIEPSMELDTPDKITKTVFCDYNPSIFAYGTNKGSIKYCDFRTSSDHISFASGFSDENSNLNKTVFANSLLAVHDINMNLSNSYTFCTRHYLSVNLWDIRKQTEPTSKFLVYEPIINKLSYLYQNNYLDDKFSLSTDQYGKYILTGGYNNMFHVIDIDQRLNTQITIDDSNEKLMNTNVIRKINSKGSCFYKKDDPLLNNINFDKKILYHAYSPVDNYSLMIVYNCIYSYCGSITKKDNTAKK
jgi:serine/threonine-protein phosphatase 2A regulatory subunit B